MKKNVFTLASTLLVVFVSFAETTPRKKKEIVKEVKVVKTNIVKKENVCTITCSVTSNGFTYVTSSGGIFTNCNKAGMDCLRKLGELTGEL